MRLLCLHGQGTNSEIFKSQTAALRFELGDDHEYNFIQGTVPSDPAPEIATLARPNDSFFSWLDPDGERSADTSKLILADLDAYIESEGPFDGVVAFSQGVAVATTYMLFKAQQDPFKQHVNPVFQFAVFFSGVLPGDLTALANGKSRQVNADQAGTLIKVPTANIWGRNDRDGYGFPLSKLCERASQEIVVHSGGHEIPNIKDRVGFRATVDSIRKAMQKAQTRY